MDIFEFNKDSPVVVEEFMDSKIYYIDDFFKNPDSLCKFLDKSPTKIHKTFVKDGFKNFNGIHFDDVKHEIYISEIKPITEYLSKICSQWPVYRPDRLVTNQIKFNKNIFNDYKNKYWYPHKDSGYTALVYLNKDDEQCGTNLYDFSVFDETIVNGEHTAPWRSREYWKCIKTIKPKYNRCVLFDGLYFFHGMNIENERYFNEEYRRNMVWFFVQD